MQYKKYLFLASWSSVTKSAAAPSLCTLSSCCKRGKEYMKNRYFVLKKSNLINKPRGKVLLTRTEVTY